MDCNVYENIARFLEVRDIARLMTVSKDWNRGLERHKSAIKLHLLLKNDIIPANTTDIAEYLCTGYMELFYNWKKFMFKHNLKTYSSRFIKQSRTWTKICFKILIIKKFYKNLDALNLF